MAKTILITGGAGFVGSHLADALLAAGHHVRIFDNLTGQVHRDGIPEYLADGAEFIQGDVRDSAAMRRALAGVEIVFHMAAAVGVGQSMYEIEHYMGTNTQGTAVLLQQLLDSKSRVEKLVLINTPAFDDLPAKDITRMQRRTAKFAFRLSRGVMGAAPLLEGVLRGSVADPDKMPMKLVARYLAPFVGPDGGNHLLTLASAIRGSDLDEDDMRGIQAPSLIVWGEEDKWCDAKLPDKLANTIPSVRLVKLPGVARLVPEESPEHLTELILDFIKKRAAA